MIEIQQLPSSQIEVRQPQIVSIFRAAFCRPPYNKPESEVIEFDQSLLGQRTREDYRFFGAMKSASGQLIGFSYGYAIASARWFSQHVRAAIAPDLAQIWLHHTFQFVELAVEPDYQGQGIGSRLHDALLDGIAYDRAVLATLQADTAAHRLYCKRGWVLLHENLFFPGIPRRYQLMGYVLRS